MLEREDIRLLRVAWLLDQPDDYRMQRRQDLERLERADQGMSPLLCGNEAISLMRNGKREVGALSYGWLLPWDPDPTGSRMVLLRRVLKERPHIKALFWDQATLYQLPRNPVEEEAFGRALKVMMDLYASAIGTTCAAAPLPFPSMHQTILTGTNASRRVLQIKDIPTRPAEYDGLLCLGGVPTGIDEAKIKEALERFGTIESCVANEQSTTPYRVKFTEHAAAEQVVTNAQKVKGLYGFAYIAYNSRPYDDLNENGGEGRGW